MKIKSDADEPSIKQSLNASSSWFFSFSDEKKKKKTKAATKIADKHANFHSQFSFPAFFGALIAWCCFYGIDWKTFWVQPPDFSRLFLTPKYFATKLLQHITLKMRLIESQTRSLSWRVGQKARKLLPNYANRFGPSKILCQLIR